MLCAALSLRSFTGVGSSLSEFALEVAADRGDSAAEVGTERSGASSPEASFSEGENGEACGERLCGKRVSTAAADVSSAVSLSAAVCSDSLGFGGFVAAVRDFETSRRGLVGEQDGGEDGEGVSALRIAVAFFGCASVLPCGASRLFLRDFKQGVRTSVPLLQTLGVDPQQQHIDGASPAAASPHGVLPLRQVLTHLRKTASAEAQFGDERALFVEREILESLAQAAAAVVAVPSLTDVGRDGVAVASKAELATAEGLRQMASQAALRLSSRRPSSTEQREASDDAAPSVSKDAPAAATDAQTLLSPHGDFPSKTSSRDGQPIDKDKETNEASSPSFQEASPLDVRFEPLFSSRHAETASAPKETLRQRWCERRRMRRFLSRRCFRRKNASECKSWLLSLSQRQRKESARWGLPLLAQNYGDGMRTLHGVRQSSRPTS